jgi:hypothetical protein
MTNNLPRAAEGSSLPAAQQPAGAASAARDLVASESAPDVVRRLEQLDDLIFPAIDGDEQALARSAPAWRQAVAELGPDAVQESRHQYLRYARSTWEFLRRNAAADRRRLLAVLKVILLLSGLDT